MALGSTQPLTEMGTRNFPGVKGGWPARKADNFTVICEPTVSQPYGLPRPVTGIAFIHIHVKILITTRTKVRNIVKRNCNRASWHSGNAIHSDQEAHGSNLGKNIDYLNCSSP
jgi:hypothetical protein